VTGNRIAKFRYARNGRRLPCVLDVMVIAGSLNHQARVAIVILAYISGINKEALPAKITPPRKGSCPAA
jgi:hypothetical protein